MNPHVHSFVHWRLRPTKNTSDYSALAALMKTDRFLCLLLVAGAPVCAADQLGTVIVEDKVLEPRVGDIIASETTGASSHIDAITLQRPGLSLAHVLARETGTQVLESGGLGSFALATLRGSSSSQIMVYLDGLLISNASGGGFNLSNIDLLETQSVDIYRGSTPAQLSKASLGGAIHIQTSTDALPGYRLKLGTGSFGTEQLALNSRQTLGNWNTLFSLSHQHSDNDFSFNNDNSTQFNPDDDFEDHRHNAEVKQSSGLLKLGRAFETDHRRDISLQWFDKQQQLPDQANSRFNRAALETRIWRIQSADRWQQIGQSNWNSKLSLQAAYTEEQYNDPNSLIGLREQEDINTTDVLSIDNYWERVREHSTLSITGNIRQERFRADDALGRLPDSKATRHELNLALQHSLYFDQQRWLITPTLRLQQIDDSIDVYSSSSVDEAFFDDYSHSSITPQVGVRFQQQASLAYFGNAGQYQRVPSFFELFGDRGLFLGNNELEPEEGNNFDVGIHWKPDTDRPWLSDLDVQISLFYNDIDSAITRVYDARGVGRSVNIPGAENTGIEWDVSGQFHNDTRWSLQGTAQDTRNLDTTKAFQGKQLSGQAAFSNHFEISHRFGSLSVIYDVQHRRDAYYDTANLRPAANQETHNVGLEYQGKDWKLEVTLKNINNDIYEDFNSYPKPGRAFFTTLTYSKEQAND